MSSAEQVREILMSINLTPIATVVTDPRLPDNPIIAANAAFEQLTGHRSAQLLGRNCRLLCGPGTEPDQSEQLRKGISAAAPVMTELTNYRADGSSFRNAVMVAPVLDGKGVPLLFIGSQMEVPHTSAHAMMARQAAAKERVDSLSRRQREVLNLMARGLLNKQIAYALGISDKTVKMHRAALIVSLGGRASADAVRIAVEAGL